MPGSYVHTQLVKTRAGPPHQRLQPLRAPTQSSAGLTPYATPDPDTPVVDDPGTPLDPDGYPQGFPGDGGSSIDDVLWLRLPADLTPWLDVGITHTNEVCPCIVMVPKTDEITGPPSAFVELLQVFANVAEHAPCLRHGHVAQQAAG